MVARAFFTRRLCMSTAMLPGFRLLLPSGVIRAAALRPDTRSYFVLGRKQDQWDDAPTRIDGQQHIGGLSVVKINQTLDHFYYVDAPTTAGPKIQPSGVGIKSEYDGAGGIYYCQEGRWLRSSFH
jgi:hypothetical protein